MSYHQRDANERRWTCSSPSNRDCREWLVWRESVEKSPTWRHAKKTEAGPWFDHCEPRTRRETTVLIKTIDKYNDKAKYFK